MSHEESLGIKNFSSSSYKLSHTIQGYAQGREWQSNEHLGVITCQIYRVHGSMDIPWVQEETVPDFLQQLSTFGWTSDAINQQASEIRARHSHHAGVSMAYLLHDFVQLAQEKSREVDPTFLKLKEAFWLNDSKLGQDRYCPRDGQLGCGVVDLLPFQHRQKQNHFMSWSWQY